MKAKEYARGARPGLPLPRTATAILVLLAFAAAGYCPPALAQGMDLSGFLTTRYRLRATANARDQDLYQYLGLDLGNPLSSKVSAHLLTRGTVDLDGHQNERGYYVFDSITDTYDSQYNGRIYYAYADVNRIPGMEVVRLGRQLIYDAPVVLYLDGARAETAENKDLMGLKFGAYGGLPVHLYEPDPEGNAMYGALAQLRPWPGAKVRLDWTHADNKYLYGAENDDFYGLGWWQTVNERCRFNVNYTRLEDKDRDLRAGAVYYNPAKDVLIQVRYYELLEPQKIYAIDFDPFYAPLGEYAPYWQVSALIYKGLGDKYGVEAGVDGRKLKEANDESKFNHEFLHYYVTLLLNNAAREGWQASVTGEVWDSYTNEDLVQTYGADLTYKSPKKMKFSVGTDYSLYKFDFYLDTEQEQVRTYYARLRYSLTDNFKADLQYRYEDGEFDDFNWLEIGATYEFGKSNEK
ncbi:MAG TPA: hypothetical protein VM658_09770 [bacterium]|nr:hypothetical protein [bacterium]